MVATVPTIDPSGEQSQIGSARHTISSAIDGLKGLAARFEDERFITAFDTLTRAIFDSRGRVIIAGMGKSGIVARKLAATLTSTGTPAMYLHPAEAGHGDLGMIEPCDIVILISRSGETPELASIIRYCKRFRVTLATITSRAASTAAAAADICIRLPSVREACPIEMAPTTSTTLQMVFGDALAIALMNLRGFSADDFRRYHPGGRLGARLLRVSDLMTRAGDVPRIRDHASLLDAAFEMTRGRLGGTAVVDANDRLIGVFTDGDLRRAVNSGRTMEEAVGGLMTLTPMCVAPGELATEACRRMQDSNVLLLFVIDKDKLVGAIHMHDVLRAGIA